jgi:hypothetical protein
VELPRAATDTTTVIERRVIEGLRRLAPRERLEQTAALCRAADELAAAGIRLREGQLSASELRARLARLRYGDELVARVEAYRARLGR